MIILLLRLFYEFFKVGLFSVGGGLATIHFLQDMGASTGWFTDAQLADMIAVSESTPGAMGVNMASYVGFTTAGPVGCAIATLGLVTPSILVVLIIARFLQKFRQSRTVDAVFYGLRPASTGLIAAAGISVAKIALFFPANWAPDFGVVVTQAINWPAVLLFAAVFVGMKFTPVKKLHPVVFIGAAALIGILFQL